MAETANVTASNFDIPGVQRLCEQLGVVPAEVRAEVRQADLVCKRTLRPLA